jgi:AraC family transcriptional activator of pobA
VPQLTVDRLDSGAAQVLDGAVVRFREEGLAEPGARRGTPAWLLAGQGGRTVVVPRTEHARLDALIDALGAELQRPPDEHSPELQRHLLSTILLWIERWYDATRTERREADDAEVQLHRRFTRLLEAARLLRFTDLAVSEVARHVGFEHPLYFSRAFKRRHDASPPGLPRRRAREVHASVTSCHWRTAARERSFMS